MSAVRLPVILLLAVLGGTLRAGTEIRAYDVRLTAAADGSGLARARLDLQKAEPGDLGIPLGFAGLQDLKLEEAPAGSQLRVGPSNGQLRLHLRLPEGVPPACSVTFSFRLPKVFLDTDPQPGEKPTLAAGNRLFRHTFVQTLEGTVGAYRMEFLFPDGLVAQGVKEALPRPKRSEVQPRVRLGRSDGRQSALLQLEGMKQGDDTSLLLELTPERKSPAWLIVGLVLAVLYLYGFRDLVRPRKPA